MTTKRFVFDTMSQLKAAKKTMEPGRGEFFRRGYKIHTDLLPGGYFITSVFYEGTPPQGIYSVIRQVDPADCRILIISSGHRTLEQATDVIAELQVA